MSISLRSHGIQTRTEEQILRESVKLLDLSQIRIQQNIREEYSEIEQLAQSIENDGLLSPITVIKNGQDEYEVLVGHRRFKAFLLLNKQLPNRFSKIPAIVKYSIDAVKRVELQIIENEQRNGFMPLELAAALKQLKEMTGQSNTVMAQRLGKSEKWIRDNLAALEIAKNVERVQEVHELESTERSRQNELAEMGSFSEETQGMADAPETIMPELKKLSISNVVEMKGLPSEHQHAILTGGDFNQKQLRAIAKMARAHPDWSPEHLLKQSRRLIEDTQEQQTDYIMVSIGRHKHKIHSISDEDIASKKLVDAFKRKMLPGCLPPDLQAAMADLIKQVLGQ